MPWLPTPRARWATGRSDSWAARGVPEAGLPGASVFSSTSPPLSHACQGWREDRAISLLVCMIGVVCISFLVLGLMIAALLAGAGGTWSPRCADTWFPLLTEAGGLALAVGRAGTGAPG